MDWLNFAIISAVSQGFLLTVLILALQTGNRKANTLLACYVGITAFSMTLHLLVMSELKFHPGIYSLYLLNVLKGPALYLYVKALVDPEFELNKKAARHTLILVPIALGYLFVLSESFDIGSIEGKAVIRRVNATYLILLIHSIIFIYGLMALQQLELHRKRLEDSFSILENISLNWLKWMIIFILGIRLNYIAVEVLQAASVLPRDPRSILNLTLNLGVIYLISIFGLRQPLIFTQHIRSVLLLSEGRAHKNSQAPNPVPVTEASPDNKNQASNTPKEASEKYKHSGLDNEAISELWNRLQTLMSSEKPFLNNELTLPQLAELLDVKAHDLSRVINSAPGHSFYELINSYRINAAKALLEAPENDRRKMLDLAMEAGYNSQSTFYSQFKKQVGMTPKQYRDQR